jgi:hypothetical protein
MPSPYLTLPLRSLREAIAARQPRREPHRMPPQEPRKLNWRLIAVHVGNTTASAGGIFNGR